jgi:hypothetical protein
MKTAIIQYIELAVGLMKIENKNQYLPMPSD